MQANDLARHLGAWSVGKGALQQKLAAALMQAVRGGTLHPGVRLPSERLLARALTVSRTTVVAAYDALRESGWLESRLGSGTWISRTSPAVAAARGAAPPHAMTARALMGLLTNREEDDLIDFALGSPMPLEDFPVERFTLPAEEYTVLVRDRFYYPLGLPALRQAVAEYYGKAGLATRPDQVLVTNGAQHAIALCAALYLERGDPALVEDPAYFGALDAFRAAGARISALAVGPEGVQPAVLRDRIIATAARLVYLTPTFQNPSGAVMPRTARREVARIAAEFGVPIIDDGTISDLILDGVPPAPVASHAPDAPVITIGSLSKLMWPGLRVGWVRAPEPVVERLARLKSALDLGSPLLTQAIAARLLGAVDEARRLRRAQLRPRRDLAAVLLREHLPDWTFRTPSGGVFLWVKLPSGDSREYAQVALRNRVVVLPGPLMSASEQNAGFLRLPFLAESETLRAGIRRLAAAWREYRSAAGRERRLRLAMV
jgi:DNA-binding transcriptional MocR family regulator